MSLAEELLADLDDNEAIEEEDDPYTSAKAALIDASVVGANDVEMVAKSDNGDSVAENLAGPLKPTHILNAPMVNAPVTAFAKLRNSKKVRFIC